MDEVFYTADMRIVIKKCSFDEFWYKDLIGIIFNIDSFCNRDYYVKHDGHLKAVLRSDAEFIDKKNHII